MCSWIHPKGDLDGTEDSVGETPTDAVETTALPETPPMIGMIRPFCALHFGIAR
jgi:hypothetical protein